jgi:N-acetylglucosaminyldiphosphoundecaprenol N-acetyl-beta-D-mannosaminyltransferase
MPTEPLQERAAPDFGREVHCLLGVPVDAVDRQAALRRIRTAAERRRRCFLSTPNVNFLVASNADEGFRRSIVHSDLSVADGMPLVWLARLLDIPVPERIAGATLFEALQEAPEPLSVYFFGGVQGAAERAMARLNEAGGKVTCVGAEFPGFGAVEDMSRPEIIARINAAQPDLLVVSLGARKGQAWIERNRDRLEVPVISHLGAVIDFAAGTQRRAPRWMQNAGLEWLWRIGQRPGLWRRYLRDGLALCGLVMARALPLAVQRTRSACFAPGEIEAQEGAHGVYLRLAGAWTRHTLGPLRHWLAAASLAGKDVRMDMREVTRVDSAALGLLMLLEDHQISRGRRFSIGALRPSVRRMFDRHGAGYLCAGGAQADAPYVDLEDELAHFRSS